MAGRGSAAASSSLWEAGREGRRPGKGALPPEAHFEVLLANILMGPLIELAPILTAHVAPGGRLVLSGLLAEQAEGVMAAYAADFDFDPPALKDGWARLSARRR